MSKNIRTERHGNNVVLYSYNVPVAMLIADRGYVRTFVSYSKTTTKHVNQFCAKNAETLTACEFVALLHEIGAR